MWYFAWILGLGFAVLLAILNALWLENADARNKAFNPKAQDDNPTNDGTVTEGNPTEDIHKTGLLLGVLNKEVEYLNDKKIKFIVMFSSKDGNEHLNALLKLTELMEDKKLFDKLDGVKSSSEAYDIINKLM